MEEKYFGCPTSQFSCQAATVRHTSGRVSPAYFKIHIWPNIATSEWDHNCPPRAEWSLKIICFDRILCIQRLGKYFDRGKISTVDISSEKWFFVRRLFSICDGLKWLPNWSRKMERLNENMRSNTGWRQQCNISPGVWIIFFKGPFIIYACIDSTMMWWNQLNCPIIPIFDACERRVKWDNGEKFPKFLSALYYTLRRVLDLDSTIRDDLLIVLAMLTPTSHNLASRFQSASEPQSDKWWAKFNCN